MSCVSVCVCVEGREEGAHQIGTLNEVTQMVSYEVCSLLVLFALVVEGDQVGGQTMVKLFILGVQHQEDQVKPVTRETTSHTNPSSSYAPANTVTWKYEQWWVSKGMRLAYLDSSVCGSCMFSTTVILSSH